MKHLVFALTCAVVSSAQEQPRPSAEIESLLDTALAAPPELAADILLTLADSRRIPSKKHRLEVIEQAFLLAAQAKFPTMVSPAVGRASHTDSGPGIRKTALGNGLSALGLRCRAVRAALADDKAKALDLFRQIHLGPFPPLRCEDALVPSVAEYYETLRELVLNAYGPKDREQGTHLEFVELAVRGIAIPAQLEPAARLLATLPLPPDRMAEFVNTYAAAWKQMNADPRSFGAVTFGFGDAIVGLSKQLRAQGVSTVPLVDAFRTYLSRHLQGKLCAETADPQEGGDRMRQLAENFFNKALLQASGATEIPPLDFDELKAQAVGGRAEFHDFLRESRSGQIMAQYQALRFGTKEQQEEYNKRERRKDGMAHFLPEEIRRSPEWETQAREFLNELDRWIRNHDEPDVDFFHQVCLRYAALLNIIPTGPLHESVFQTYLSFLKTSGMERENAAEWLIHVKRLFRITDATPEHLEHVRSEVRKFGSPTMGCYAELARLEARQRATGKGRARSNESRREKKRQ